MDITFSEVIDPTSLTNILVRDASNSYYQPVLDAPTVILASAQSGDTVGTNASFSYEFDRQMDPGTVNVNTLRLVDYALGYLTGGTTGVGTVTLSSDLKTETLTFPAGTLIPGHSVYAYSQGAQDLAGNVQNGFSNAYVTVGAAADTTPPVVLETNPPANLTGVPLNAPIEIEFSKEIAQDSIGSVQLLLGSAPVAVTSSFSRPTTLLTLPPHPNSTRLNSSHHIISYTVF